MMKLCAREADNPALYLGAVLGELAKAGRDKLTLIISPAVSSFGDWIEQLIAESTGKDGKGILPVAGESPVAPNMYGDDRLFVFVGLDNDVVDKELYKSLKASGYPLLFIHLADVYDLGGQFFLWELATGVAGHCLGINPFDQPNVESAKVLARKVVDEYKHKGVLAVDEPAPLDPNRLGEFITLAQPGAYIALQAYLNPTPSNHAGLVELRQWLCKQTHLATTLGYGPRYLHSTGQLHKGDAGKGLFIQLTAEAERDAAIPDEAGRPETSISFAVLEMAQAYGDRQALREAGRTVIRFHLGGEAVGGLKRLIGV